LIEGILYLANVHSERGHFVLQFAVYSSSCVDVSDVCNFCVSHQKHIDGGFTLFYVSMFVRFVCGLI